MLLLLIFCLILQIQTIISFDPREVCDSQFCTNGTTCTYRNKLGDDCQCMPGFSGINCTDRNECSVGIEDPCHHRGVCHNTVGSYSCMCLSSWNGSHCEQKVKSEIECLPGYIGDECEKPLCKPGYALNNTGSSTNYTCYCEKGWNHTHTNDPCDKDIDECKLYPNICKNRGSCSNTNGSYICYCIEPWERENCTFYNACRSNPCANQGKCAKTGNDTDRTYKCTCQLGYKGENCTLDVDECSLKTNNECVHGNCSNSIGSYNCTCETGWTSKTCNETIDITVTIEQTTKVRPELTTTEIYRPSSKITRGKTYNQTEMTTLKKGKTTETATNDTTEQTTKVRPELTTTEIYRPSSKITHGIKYETYKQTTVTKTTTKMSTVKTTNTTETATNDTTEQTTKVRPELTTTEIYRSSSKITHGIKNETYKQTTVTKSTTNKTTVKTTNTTETANDGSLAMKESRDGLPIIVGASVGGVIIAIAAVVGIYLYKRKRARIASEDITGDTGRNEKFNIERIFKTDRVAPESTTDVNSFTSEH